MSTDFMPLARWQRWLLIALEALLALVGLGLGHLLRVAPLSTVELNVPSILWGLAATVPMLLLAAAIGRFETRFTRALMQVVDELIVPMFRDWTLLDLALAGACAGIGEEILFRGALQAAASETYGPVIGLVSASVIFGVVHAVNASYAVFATLLGVYLGLLWQLTDNLVAPIIAHGLYDFLALIYLTRIRHPVDRPAMPAPSSGD